jgi:tetratricopeptide (TPR) repeat protein
LTSAFTNQCEKALDIDPDFYPAHLVAGLVFEREGRFDHAIENLEKAWRASDGGVLVRTILQLLSGFSHPQQHPQAIPRGAFLT